MGGSYSTPDVKTQWFHDFAKGLPSMNGKSLVITGTTSGTGLVAARTFAEKGGRVFMLNRPSERATKAKDDLQAACPGASVTHIDCDLQDFDSVRSAAQTVKDAVGSSGIDVLANNAGVMAIPDRRTKDGYEAQMQTNHLSHFLLTSLLLPALETAAAARGSARIVNHSSVARHGEPLERKYFEKSPEGSLGGDGNPAKARRYHHTKLANAVFTEALQDRLDERGSKVMALVCTPGVAASSLMATTSKTSGALSNAAFGLMMRGAQSAEDGTMPLLACMCAEDAHARAFYRPSQKGLVGRIFNDELYGPAKKFEMEDKYKTEEQKTLLWEASEAACGPFFP